MQITEVGVQKLFRLFGRFSVVTFFILGTLLSAGSFEDFKRSQASAFEAYKDKRDGEFKKYLQKQWQEFEAFKSPALYEKPKPKTIAKVPEKKIPEVGPAVDIEVKKVVIPAAEKKPLQKPVVVDKESVHFNFFGEDVRVHVEKRIRDLRLYPKNQKGIVEFFSALAGSGYEPVLEAVTRYTKKLRLNDWGRYMLIRTISKNIYKNADEEKLFTWFVLNKFSYDVKVGISGGHIVLLVNSKQVIYSTPRFKLDKKYYYAVDFYTQNLGPLMTYNQNYPQANKALDFRLKKMPSFALDVIVKHLSFSYLGQEYSFDVRLNKNLINFLGSYPQVDYDVYFNAPMDPVVLHDLSKGIRRYINGKKASYGISFILRFVQKAFVYQRDDEQFGHEKIMFAEETLYYDKSDCEDRAILFSKLIKIFFGFNVVGVKYPNHMSTALNIPLSGDSVKVGSTKYIIADPTYINANIGQNMPKFKKVVPEGFIKLKI